MKRDSFRALRHRNFRLFLICQGISLMGMWMTRLAGRKAVQGFYRVIFWGAVLMAVGSAGFSLSRNVWLSMAFMGSVPLGSLIAGSVAPVIGAPGTVLVCGVGALLGAAWFWLKVPQPGAIPGPGESARAAVAASA